MATRRPKHLFVSYARGDLSRVLPFLDSVRAELDARGLPVDLWQDNEQLRPGESWQASIQQALADSIGLLVFVSRQSMQSAWVRSELDAVLQLGDRPIYPVILDHVPDSDLPPQVRHFQWLDLSSMDRQAGGLQRAAAVLVDGIQASGFAQPPLTERLAARFADFAANAFRKQAAPVPAETPQPVASSVFVVHGHDAHTRDQVCDELRRIGVEPVTLAKERGPSQSLLQKFLRVAERANFAIVLLTPDDFGASLRQYDQPGVGTHALKFRARQNVILELGFFYGRLGWENVFVLQGPAPKAYPDFEHPSDLAGVVFEEIDEAGAWKAELARKLAEAGFSLRG